MIYGQLMVAAVLVLLKSNLKPHFNSVFVGYNDSNIYIFINIIKIFLANMID